MAKSKIKNAWVRKKNAVLGRNPHRFDGAPKNHPSKLVQMHCSADVEWLENSTSFGGHSRPAGGHRRVSGLVRASLKREFRRLLAKEDSNSTKND